jgi:hypothetical protein
MRSALLAVVVAISLWTSSRFSDSARPNSTVAAPTPTPPLSMAGWIGYNNPEMDFSAYIPEGWKAEVHAQEKDNPSRAVSFEPPPENMGPDATMITVLSIAIPDTSGSQPYTSADLMASAKQWASDRGLRIVANPSETSISNWPAVTMVHEADAKDKTYTVRGYGAFISTSKSIFYIEVAALAPYDVTIRQTFETFVDRFSSPTRSYVVARPTVAMGADHVSLPTDSPVSMQTLTRDAAPIRAEIPTTQGRGVLSVPGVTPAAPATSHGTVISAEQAVGAYYVLVGADDYAAAYPFLSDKFNQAMGTTTLATFQNGWNESGQAVIVGPVKVVEGGDNAVALIHLYYSQKDAQVYLRFNMTRHTSSGSARFGYWQLTRATYADPTDVIP